MENINIRLEGNLDTDSLEVCFIQDPLGRQRSVRNLLNVIDEIEGSYTLFVDGAWGCGKSYAVSQVIELMRHFNEYLNTDIDSTVLDEFCTRWNIQDLNRQYLPIYFNAWENDHYDDPLCPLLCEMSIQLDVNAGTTGCEIDGAIIKAIDSVLKTNISEISKNIRGKDLLEDFKERIFLRNEFDAIVDLALPGVADKLVLFIDELDRCRPEFAIRLLEETKRLFDDERVMLVFSTDIVQLGHSLAGIYGDKFDAKKYLERFYDRKIELSKFDALKYLESLGFVKYGNSYFVRIISELIAVEELTIRDMQRLAPIVLAAAEYAHTYCRDFESRYLFSLHGMLPVFVILAYKDPENWRNTKETNDFKFVYEYSIRSVAFVELIKRANRSSIYSEEDIDENQLQTYFNDMCTTLFIDNQYDLRRREAETRLGKSYYGIIDREALLDFDFA